MLGILFRTYLFNGQSTLYYRSCFVRSNPFLKMQNKYAYPTRNLSPIFIHHNSILTLENNSADAEVLILKIYTTQLESHEYTCERDHIVFMLIVWELCNMRLTYTILQYEPGYMEIYSYKA